MLQIDKPEDLVICTGESHSVRELLKWPSVDSTSTGNAMSKSIRATFAQAKSTICAAT